MLCGCDGVLEHFRICGTAQIATGCCLVAAIIMANIINGAGDFSANMNTGSRVGNAAACVVAEASPLAPKRARGSLGHGPRRGCVCGGSRRGHHFFMHLPTSMFLTHHTVYFFSAVPPPPSLGLTLIILIGDCGASATVLVQQLCYYSLG